MNTADVFLGQDALSLLSQIPGVPQNVRRVVIDIGVDGLVHIYYEVYGTPEVTKGILEIIRAGTPS